MLPGDSKSNGQINVGCTSDGIWGCFWFAFPLEQSVLNNLLCSIVFSVCMQLIYRCCALENGSGCSSINQFFSSWFGREFKGLCKSTVNFRGFALILVLSAFESVVMSNCCWIGLLLCPCSFFQCPSVVFGFIAGLMVVSVKLFDYCFFIWCLRPVTILDAVSCEACVCSVVSSGQGIPLNSPRSACRTSPRRRIPAF